MNPAEPDRKPIKSLTVLPSSDRLEAIRSQAPERSATSGGPVPVEEIGKNVPESRRPLLGSVIAALRTVYDPELPVNIFDLGLVYEISLDEQNTVDVKMTLTAPGCPVAGTLPGEIQRKIAGVPGISGARVELVWDPPWTRDRMTEVALLELGL